MGRTRKRVVRLRRDPAAIFKQFGVTFTGLVIVSITMVGIIITHGDQIDAGLDGDTGQADIASAQQESASQSPASQASSADAGDVSEEGQVNLTDLPDLT